MMDAVHLEEVMDRSESAPGTVTNEPGEDTGITLIESVD